MAEKSTRQIGFLAVSSVRPAASMPAESAVPLKTARNHQNILGFPALFERGEQRSDLSV